MIGFTLGRYFFMRYLSITLWFFAGVAALVFVISFTEFSGSVSSLAEYSAAQGLAFAALQTPMIMQQAVPFICLIAGIVTLVSLNRKYELVVARAAGISAWQFLVPIALASFFCGVLTLALLNPFAAYGVEKSSSIESSLRGSAPQAAAEVPWIKQRTADGETIIGARTVLNLGLELRDTTFLRIDKAGDISERIDAEVAHLRDGRWELQNALRYRGTGIPEHVATMDVPTNLTPEFVLERLADPEAIPFYELPQKIAAARSFGLGADAFAMHFHSLVALPALLVTMTLIAATVSMRFARMGQSATIILGGVLAGFLLYVISVLVQAFGSAGFVPPIAAAWFPVVVAGFFGVTFLLYREDG
jgi:lipopolysaccharide export system permease protein